MRSSTQTCKACGKTIEWYQNSGTQDVIGKRPSHDDGATSRLRDRYRPRVL